VESLSKRATFLDRVVGEALREIGFRWERGDLTVDEEHRASHLVIESIDRLRPDTPEGPVALLACPPDELHDLPLRLVRLVLEWAGWRTEFIGAGLPWRAAHHAVEKCPDMIAFSARSATIPNSSSAWGWRWITFRDMRTGFVNSPDVIRGTISLAQSIT
jgi:methanogenic corrinoid protein MtbC1